MHLYNLELQSPTAIENAVIGHFSGKREQELLLGKNDRLEIWKLDQKSGKLACIHSENLFGKIRTAIPFRLTGGTKDYIIVSSDSGAINILEFIPEKRIFIILQQEYFGRSGFRRIIPGQYLTADPRGRAVMIAAVEKQKFVYILNRDSEANLTISSPLEAHKNATICYDCIGVDVGYENPIFASLESSYQEIDRDPTGEALLSTEKNVVYYELDLGLNHVVRQWSVPGGDDGPSGILVCSEGFITYKSPGQRDHRIPIPRRVNPLATPNRDPIIISSVVHRMKNSFFILVQSDDGDLFKISIDYNGTAVNNLKIKYFDTIPVSNSLCIFRSGFLFCAAESGNHQFYQFENLGEETDTPEFISTDYPFEGDYEITESTIAEFQPHTFSSLSPVSEIDSLAPSLGGMVYNLAGEENPQFYSLCGQGAQSALKVVRYGLEVTEMAVSELPGSANGIWTIKKSLSEEFDSYIVISFIDATLVLQIGDEVEEVMDSGFLNSSPTLCVQLMADGTLLQICPLALRHIFPDGRVTEWKPPGNREIIAACSNSRQAAIALNRGEIILFELDTQMGILSEWSDKMSIESDVVCMNLPSVKEGRLRAPILAIGCNDQTARIISVEPKSVFENLSTLALSDLPESICLSELTESTADSRSNSFNTLFLFVGLRNGLMQRTSLDSSSFEMTDTRTRFLGLKPVKLFPIKTQNQQCVLTISSRSWLNHMYQGQNKLAPLSYDALDFGTSFSSEQCPEGIVALSQNTLRIVSIDRIDTQINQASIPLSYTPRGMIMNSTSKNFAIIETDHGFVSNSKWASDLVSQGIVSSIEEANSAVLPSQQFGYIRGDANTWCSCIRVLNPFTGDTTQLLELENNEAAYSIANIQFHTHIGVSYVVVGTGVEVTLRPRSCKDAYLRVYAWDEKGETLSLLHKTPVDQVPQSLVQFQGRLAAGIGNSLVLFDLGKKQLLRKAHLSGLPNMIARLTVVPISSIPNQPSSDYNDNQVQKSRESNRIVIADVQESIHYCIYSAYSQQFVIVCDDSVPRYITSMCCLDRDTIAVADKFGTFSILRLPEELLLQLRRQSTVSGQSNAQQLLTAIANKRSASVTTKKRAGGMKEAPYKFSLIAQYYIGGGDIITNMYNLPSWQYGGGNFGEEPNLSDAGNRPVLLYTTILGQIGAMVPLVYLQTDVEFFTNLESHLRSEQFNARKFITGLGDEHLFYRSKVFPVKNVIDGAFCEKFASIPPSDSDGIKIREKVANALDRSVEEIIKKLEDTRALNIF
ncbi:hypothetical protein BB560_000437 [Smittium megazygosporum]|uniref:DNA damage-binding protein 1 n=1 Tax=Smittium megazygosporum TaxID=133381 RepID=A0A2T9ZKC6_9FUNG|nr:hypothetical protein BB560_000437 [Smittium megazygosporum]